MLFGTHKIPYRLVDIANNENSDVKKILHRENGKLIIPQVFVKDEYKAVIIITITIIYKN